MFRKLLKRIERVVHMEDKKIDMEDVLLSGSNIQIKPHGYSMYPLLVPERDEIIVSPIVNYRLKRGDLVVYRREKSILVCHRIWKVKKDGYYMVGDNQKEIEGPLQRHQIKGIVICMIRKGKRISSKNVLYIIYSYVWLLFRPVRPFISKMVSKIKKGFR